MSLISFALAASLLAGGSDALAQYQPGVYSSSLEYVQNSPWHPGTVSSPAATHPYVEVVNARTYTVHRVPLAHAWGYTDTHGVSFRLVKGKAYRVQPQQNGLVVYSRPRTLQNGRYTQVVTEYFFSEGLDGELHPLTKRTRRQQGLATS